jgi:hypothetical protein
MSLTKCKECGNDISSTAKVCPNCGALVKKTISTGVGCLIVFVFCFIIYVIIAVSNSGTSPTGTSPITELTPTHNCNKIKEIFKSKNFPKYKVIWRSYRIVSVLVDPSTTSHQLKTLIYAFRDARNSICLSGYIPATSPGVKNDPHDSPIILVFSDPKWATEDEYKKYERSGMTSPVAQIYLNHVRASYERDIDGKEYGSLGYDEGVLRSATYKKLF